MNGRARSDLSRRLAAFWFADIVGFTSMSARDERAALEAVAALRTEARRQVERAGGRLVKVSGDAVLAEFRSSDAALGSAIALRDALARKLELHFGVHLGEVSTEHGDIYGDGVNTAARLQAQAAAGQILASEDVYRHVRANPAFRFEPVGALELKGLPAPLPAYSVRLADPAEAAATGGGRAAALAEGTRPAVAEEPPSHLSKRLVVAPFRSLRPDEETAFLSFSLADAVSFSLSNLESIVVRTSHVAGPSSTPVLDPREIARKTDVDLVVTGTLLRVGDRLQVTAELTEGLDGTRLGSFRTHAGLGDLFELQEEMTTRIVEALALPLTARERSRLQHDVPATPRAYELYLRAKEMGQRIADFYGPRDLYLAALAEDPTYAPAWAELGRCYRLIAKYHGMKEVREYNFAQAEAALEKAVELNPDLDLAHGYAAQLETDLGRCGDAMDRLLQRLETRPRGVDLLGSLVQVLRYCGLLDESLAADAEARAIDPAARTSIAYTHFLRGEYEEAARKGTESDLYLHALAHLVLDRGDRARELLDAVHAAASPLLQRFVVHMQLLVDGQVDAAAENGAAAYRDFPDPEGRFLFARTLAWIGRSEESLRLLEGVAPEYAALPPPGRDPWLASVDTSERYGRLLEEVQERREGFRERHRARRGMTASG